MRVLIVNTSEKTGGAAVAANRLMEALNNNGVKTKMLVRDKETEQITVVGLKKTWFTKWHFLWERLVIFIGLHFTKHNLFQVDIANSGFNITKLREFKEADVIHLNWINQGMLSLKNIRCIMESNKPIVWTMHDMWPATAICHYTRDCDHFQSGCCNCPYLPNGGSAHDLAAAIWKKKLKLYFQHDISFVTCSKWLENEAKKSALMADKRITSIPNSINTNLFKPKDKRESRIYAGLPLDKNLILFVSQKVTDERKGMKYFIEACDILIDKHPELKEKIGIAILGGRSEDIAEKISLPTYSLGYVSDERKITSIYNAVNTFVLPSMEDNLPNTIMESMACGIPCVGFNVGGIPEMIDHHVNGYVAKVKDSHDLASGIYYVLQEADYSDLSKNAVKKVSLNYSQHAVAMKYMDVYDEALTFKNYRL